MNGGYGEIGKVRAGEDSVSKMPGADFGKMEIKGILDERGISYEYREHPPLFTMEDIEKYGLPHRELIAKNVFASDDKRRTYFLISIKGDERADLKAIGKPWGYNHLRFASAEELRDILGLWPGAVSPFGLLNDAEKRVIWCLDRRFVGGTIGAHPNDNSASIWLRVSDLTALIEEHGNRVCLF